MIYLLLPATAFMVFWQLNRCDFINYDDPAYVTENIHIRNGMTTEAVRWAFTTGYASNWHPVTWMSHMLDVQLFGLNPRGHHLTNLLLHIANTLLLFFVFNRMTKAPWKSTFVAALFALHPLHVESVAWVAERKDVLSTFFWMLTIVAYIHYVAHRRLHNYLSVLIFFGLGLMAKPMVVTLPFVLLLLDYWPLGRLQGAGSGEHGAGSAKQTSSRAQEPLSANKRKSRKKLTDQSIAPPSVPVTPEVFSPGPRHPGSVQSGASVPSSPPSFLRPPSSVNTHHSSFIIHHSSALRPLLLEKIPLFALAAFSCIVTFIAQQKGGAVKSIEVFPFSVRIANALVSYVIYIEQTLWPHNLAVFYPHPGLWPLWRVLGSGLLLIGVTFIAIWKARRVPCLAFGWLWFTGTLVPVIGIVQVGRQALADRYTYIPLIGLFIMAAWGIPELLKKWRATHLSRKEKLFASSALVLISLFIVTWVQVGYWRDSLILYDHALRVTGPNDTIHYSRGLAYATLGDYRQAIEDYDEAIAINPEAAEAYNNRGGVYSKLGNNRQAISDYDRAIQIYPKSIIAYYNRGEAYGKLGNYRQAISDYDRAIEIDPQDAEIYNNRGLAYGELGDQKQAVSDYDRAMEIRPRYADAYNNRGVAYGVLGNFRQAIEDFDVAVDVDSEHADPYYNRGVAYGQLGNYGKAIENYDKAIDLDPGSAKAHFNRGLALAKIGRDEQAIEDLKRAAKLDCEEAKVVLKSRGINWSD